MKPFMNEDFLLDTPTASHLFHSYAEKLPIIDYHCHLSPADIALDKSFTNITEAWLYGDHYKWRGMRSCGIDEKYITGDASDYERFRAYCSVMPKLAGNPLYHWSHLELRRYFDCDLIINEKNCDEIWRITSEKFAKGGMSARALMVKSGVKLVCTTDDPADSLEYHKALAADGFEVKVLPAFRPDKSINIERRGITEYIKKLSASEGIEITDLASLQDALRHSLDRFCALGCRTADHGMDIVRFAVPNEYAANEILKKAIAGDGVGITEEELALYQTQMNRFFGQEYKKRNMVLQLHFGVLRNPNQTMFERLGPDSGYDTINGQSFTAALAGLLNYLSNCDGLPKTILYSINPCENEAVGTLCGSFCANSDGFPTVVQGSAWWFNDHIDGMDAQMRSYANLAGFGNFLGMLTDSRSFMSYPRHEYFRRILCRLVGEWVEKGLLPYDEDMLSTLISDICYYNSNRYFHFDA